MRSIHISFTNKTGKKLDGRLELPVTGKPYAYAIFAHCFTCDKTSKAATLISRALAKKNIGVLRFDFTGIGESEGEFKDTTFSSDAADIVSAANFLRDNYSAPQLLIGHSLGGTASIIASANIPEVSAVCTIGSPAEPDHIKDLFTESEEQIKKEGKVIMDIGGRPFIVSKKFLEDIDTINLGEILRNHDNAILILHSPADKIVDISNASKLFYKAKEPRSFISMDNADHLLTNRSDSEYAGEIISSWSTRYIKGEPYQNLKTDKQAVVRIGTEKYYTEIIAGEHQMVGDEPVRMGGKDLGPTPYDYLVVALGTCTAMTLRMYADHKGLPVDEVIVHLEHYKTHKEDCDCEGGEKLDKILREIKIEGDLTEEQHNRMLQIADRCPVHKTLKEGVDVSTSIVEEISTR